MTEIIDKVLVSTSRVEDKVKDWNVSLSKLIFDKARNVVQSGGANTVIN